MALRTPVRIIDKDKGFKALHQLMKESKKSLAVGILSKDAGFRYPPKEGEKPKRAITLYEVAVANEFGTSWIPARSFLAATIDKNQAKYVEDTRKVALAIIDKRETINTGLAKLGERIVTDIKNRIIAHIPPENSDYTKAHKESTTPLIDDGHLIGSIHYEVRDI